MCRIRASLGLGAMEGFLEEGALTQCEAPECEWLKAADGAFQASNSTGPGRRSVWLECDLNMSPEGQLEPQMPLTQTRPALKKWAAPHTVAPCRRAPGTARLWVFSRLYVHLVKPAVLKM